ncbi:MAG: hypothetical protein JWQ63_1198 [Mucilaginibacter sp.]|jgi:tetratricopeptide (TPR) repeat protein|nr:hypothetical protein [Mucilaginibacter sp.]
MKGNILGFCILLFITSSAFPQVKKRIVVHKSAFELNQIAIMLFQQYSYNQDSIRKSIKLLDMAIATDSTYFTAHINKVSLLCELGQNTEVLEELTEAMKLHEKDPQLICMQAFILEKSGLKDAAMHKYKEADTLYTQLIKDNQNFVTNKIAKAFLQFFLKDKKEGVKQYNQIARAYKNKEVSLMKNAFYTFKREEFIKSYCLPPQPLQTESTISYRSVR